MCSSGWATRDEFRDEKSNEINGYGTDFEKLESSLFYFTHIKEGCFSTITIAAKEFFDLSSGKQYTERRTGKEECPGYCPEKEQLQRCDAFCECAFNREIIQLIKDRHKK